jgi:hypothetical protein
MPAMPPPAQPETIPMIDDEREKLRAEIRKITAETMKINAEARWHPYVAVAGTFAAALGLLKLLGS